VQIIDLSAGFVAKSGVFSGYSGACWLTFGRQNRLALVGGINVDTSQHG
jgi:hypothetical protein